MICYNICNLSRRYQALPHTHAHTYILAIIFAAKNSLSLLYLLIEFILTSLNERERETEFDQNKPAPRPALATSGPASASSAPPKFGFPRASHVPGAQYCKQLDQVRTYLCVAAWSKLRRAFAPDCSNRPTLYRSVWWVVFSARAESFN